MHELKRVVGAIHTWQKFITYSALDLIILKIIIEWAEKRAYSVRHYYLSIYLVVENLHLNFSRNDATSKSQIKKLPN